jgi:CRISPR-associated protein Csd2
MTMRGLIVFKHESRLGNCPSHLLFDRIKIQRKDSSGPARSFADFDVIVDRSNLPKGIELIEF